MGKERDLNGVRDTKNKMHSPWSFILIKGHIHARDVIK